MAKEVSVARVAPTMAPVEFAEKWGPGGTADGLNERAGAQPHFMDLCAMLGVPSPADPDAYCFERGLWGSAGGRRFADVWKRGHFGWEYKAPGGSLTKALDQLMLYALPLDNPPLLIVSDRHSIEIHTHFTGHPSAKTELSHADLRDPGKQALLRSAFLSPDDFRPKKTTEQITQEMAGAFACIADALRDRGETPFRAAHFLTQCIFCCFAESAGLVTYPFVGDVDPRDPYWSLACVKGVWHLASTEGTPLMGPYTDGHTTFPGEKSVRLKRPVTVPRELI